METKGQNVNRLPMVRNECSFEGYDAAALMRLFERCDALRRPARFSEALLACECDARGRLGFELRDYPQAAYLRAAMQAAREVAVQPLLAQGFKGAELGEALNRARLQALSQFRQAQRQASSAPASD